jgi:hypothetical protein
MDGAFVDSERNAIYENVITNHKNIQTTFKAVQQLKQMLGEVAEDINELAEGEDDGERRLQVVECEDGDACSKGDCKCAGAMDPNKRDPTKKCDCEPNYEYIMIQKGAGCDEFDSDGDNIIDFCEDRHAPTLMFANAALFKCDEADLAKHCYTEKVFLNNDHAENFLKDQVIVTDDCLIANGLDMDISHEGTCSETVFTLTPKQTYTQCDVSLDISPGGLTFYGEVYNVHTPGSLQLCQGDCDYDSDCAEGLICFQRAHGTDVVPGCTGIGEMWKYTYWDFCIHPNENSRALSSTPNRNLFTQTLPFDNPLLGREKHITVQVDDEDPVVTCGFHDIHQDNSKVHVDVDGGYLFHYSTPDETNGLAISSFKYTITVSFN